MLTEEGLKVLGRMKKLYLNVLVTRIVEEWAGPLRVETRVLMEAGPAVDSPYL